MIPQLLALCLSITTPSFHEGLRKDLGVLREAYTQIHPGLYRYNTRAQMATNFRVLRSEFDEAPDLRAAYVALSHFTAKVKCGHTYPNFFNQNKHVVKEVFSGQNRVPFHFRWLEGKMVVISDLTPNHALPPGTEIRSIDGIPSFKIFRQMMRVARADGSNDAKRASILGVDGKSKYEAFDIYLPLLFPIKPGELQFKVREPDGKIRRLEAKALSMEDRINDSTSQAKATSRTGEPWDFELVRRVGRLTMPTWALYDSSWNWKGYLAETFRKLSVAKAKALIIDLRGNEGGSAVGDEMVQYFLDRPVTFQQYKLYTRYEKVSPALRPYLDTWDRSFDDWSKWTRPAHYLRAGHNRFHRMTLWEGAGRTGLVPKPNAFHGKVLVLVDSSNSSATFEFDQMVQTHHLATLIGEPTGGNQRGINGSAFYFLNLPNSGLEVDLPLCGAFPDTLLPDAGLQPDVLVRPTARDFAAGRDVGLERARRLAESLP